MRPTGSPRVLERRRRRAVALLQRKVLSLREVARRVKSSVSSVHRWWQAWREHGASGLDAKPVPGRPRKLSDRERERLIGLLVRGAVAAGFRTDVWTLKRIAVVIRREFGVRYHPAHVWKVMRACGWRWQVAQRRVVEDGEDIEGCKRQRWRAKKSARTWGPCRPARGERVGRGGR